MSAREGVDYDPILPLHELQPDQKYYLGMFLTGSCRQGPQLLLPYTLDPNFCSSPCPSARATVSYTLTLIARRAHELQLP